MTVQTFFSRRFLWALVVILPAVILLLNAGKPSAPDPAAPRSAEPASTFELVAVQDPGAGRSFNVRELGAPGTARTLFVEAHELPVIDIRLVFDGGAARDGALPGLASLTSGLLREGTLQRSAAEVAEQFEQVGARFDTGAWRDMAMVELRVLSEPDQQRAAVDMLREILGSPAFSEAALQRDRKQAIAGLQARRQQPSSVLGDAWYPALYPDHPYGSPPQGTEASLRAITRQHVLDFYRRYYNRNNVVISIVGDLDEAHASGLSRSLLEALYEGDPAPVPPAPPATRNQRIDIEFPSAQVHLRIGLVGVDRVSEDLPALMVGNEILGGSGLVSMLSQEIREKRGLAYSVYSSFAPMRVAGPFSIGLQTRADQAGEATELALEQLRQFVAEGPSENQVAKARSQLAGAFALGTASNASIAAHLASIAFYGLPADYLEQHLSRISRVTRQQVLDAFQRHVHPDRLLVMQVGPTPADHDAQ